LVNFSSNTREGFFEKKGKGVFLEIGFDYFLIGYPLIDYSPYTFPVLIPDREN
jgi:hypothetical protein